jgi:hypothetical protein
VDPLGRTRKRKHTRRNQEPTGISHDQLSTINHHPLGGPLSSVSNPIIPARISVVTIRLIFALCFGNQNRSTPLPLMFSCAGLPYPKFGLATVGTRPVFACPDARRERGREKIILSIGQRLSDRHW